MRLVASTRPPISWALWLLHGLASWWRLLRLAALLAGLALAPGSAHQRQRRVLAYHIVQGTSGALAGFTVVSLLISLVLIRIVLVTALSYGLTQYALEMVVRVLVLELIPLTAALFAALRCSLPMAAEIAALRAARPAGRGHDIGLLRGAVLPRVGASLFCALLLAAVSCAVTLVVAYLSVYGPTTAGLAAYTHTVGHVFNPAVALILSLKIVCFSLAVGLIPAATVLDDGAAAQTNPGASTELRALVRLALAILVIETASLMGNYA